MSLTFGIDFDKTITADPEFFRDLIELIRDHGHRAVIVTGRSDEFPWSHEVRVWVQEYFADTRLPIVFAAAKWKRQAALEEGYVIDIWMDDFPEYIAPQDADKVAFKVEASSK